MIDTASHPFVDILRSGLRRLKSVENAMDFSMDDILLGRIEALEKVVAILEARIDGLGADRPPNPHDDVLTPLTPTIIDFH